MPLLFVNPKDGFSLAEACVSKNYFRNTIRVTNGLDPGQDGHSVGPDLNPNCLQRLSVDDKVPASKRVKELR